MKKRVFFVFTILCLIFFSVISFAHSGRTDSNGGHINHATGEYHYHHGYSAHNHYDIDGDGKEDCPMTYKSSNSSSYQISSNNTPSSDGLSSEEIWSIVIIGVSVVLIVGSLFSKKNKK